MKNFLSPSNPLYEDYYKILIELNRLVPHNQFVKEYIVSNFFPWKEQYFNKVLDVYNELLVYSEQNMFSSKIFTSNDYSDKINEAEEILKDIPSKRIKISVTDKSITSFNPFSPQKAKFEKEKNTLSLSNEEENYLNNGHYKKEVSKRFNSIKKTIETFFRDNKKEHIGTLKECFKELSNFEIDNQNLKIAYKNQPKLVQENLDLLGFKDFNETCWQDLKMFIEEKKIIVENLSSSKSINIQPQSEKQKIKNKDFPDIFKSYECYQKYLNVLEGIGVDFSNTGKTGFKVKFWAMWKNPRTREYFKTYMLKKDYADFLNEYYEGNYDSTSTSRTYKASEAIDEYLTSL